MATRQSDGETSETETGGETPNEHRLVTVIECSPGIKPGDDDVDPDTGTDCRTRFWRCTYCGQERSRRDEFHGPCAVGRPRRPLVDGGYDLDDPRTWRAVTEEMSVRFGDRGCRYTVEGERGVAYEVDVAARTCTCPDHTRRGVVCKHVRRVDLDIRAGTVPRPDGKFLR
jgi:hypothetical protein